MIARRWAAGLAIGVLAVAAIGCGDDDGAGAPAASGVSSTAPALTPTTAGAATTTTAVPPTAEAPTVSTTTTATSTTLTSTTTTTAPPVPATSSWWRPAVGVTWQWQLSGELDLSDPAEVYEIDWETTTADDVAALHARGKRALCYVSAGSWESYRPDAADFPDEVLGEPLDGFPDERWLDIRRLDLLEPLLARRFDVCREKGFDGIEADNVDGYANPSGFDLTGDDQLAFNRRVADLAHERGMAIALKNDLDQVATLVGAFDLAVNEQCVTFDECDALLPFIEQGKPVLHAEYEFDDLSFCAVTVPLGFSSILKNVELDAPVERC